MLVRSTKGFTLIELLITVSIMAVLASVAFPSYQNHLTRLRASDAQAQLLDVMQRQRKYFTDRNLFTEDLSLITNLESYGEAAVTTEKGYHSISTMQCGSGESLAVCVKLVATPIGRLGDVTFQYNSRNEKFPAEDW